MNEHNESIVAENDTPALNADEVAGGWRGQIVVVSILIGCICIGIIIRAFGIGTPITGIRDTHTASITRNLMRDGIPGILKPRVDYPGDQPGYLALELPILNSIQALTSRLIPWAGEAAFRLPSLLAYIFGALALFDIARRRLGEREACFAVALTALFPVHITTSVSPAPDQASISLAVIGLAGLDRFLDSNRLATLAVAALALSAAILVKPPTLVFALPCAVLVMTRRGWRAVLRPPLVIAALLAVTPLVGWMIHSRHLNETSKLNWDVTAAQLVDVYINQRGRVQFYGDLGWYRVVADNLVIGFTAAGVALAVIGLFVAIRRRLPFGWVLIAWFVALLSYVFVLPFHLATHKYYVLPFAPLIALLGGLSLAILSDRKIRRRTIVGSVIALGVVATVAISVPSTVKKLKSFPRCRVVFGEVAQKRSSPDDLIITAVPGMRAYDGILLYRANRRGWKLPLQPDQDRRPKVWGTDTDAPTTIDRGDAFWTKRSIAGLELMRDHGASLIGILGSRRRLTRTAPGFMAYLEENYTRVAKVQCCVFYDLSTKRQ